ncbi:MAG: hypothetical protein L0211_22715 [Planctomycetaceae bacterium]|nr:hypothetical protein [Planctomycetaceae bacterium]
MSWQGKSILTGIVVAAALAGLALIGTLGSRASTQAGVAQAQEAKAREAEAKAPEALAARAKQAPPKEAQAKGDALAAQARAAIAAKGKEWVTLDLSKVLLMKAENFEKSTRHPWPAVPRGSQNFAGVPVDIQGATMLWGQRNADAGLAYPEQITGIGCQQKFETLYILHATFYEAAAGQPAFDVVLNYQGGEKQTDTILCGEDSRDWYINNPYEKDLGPSSKRSTLAWTGKGKAGDREQAIRFCLTAIENKQPDRPVATIDLVSSKQQTAGCILAITVGKAGLLKPHLEKPTDTNPPASP